MQFAEASRMKRIIFTFIAFSITIFSTYAQKIYSDSQVILDNQSNPDIAEINSLWENYLQSSPDSLYNNPCWNNADKLKYKSYDLLRSEGYLSLYGLAEYGELKNLVLSIKPIDSKYYDIHSMYYWGGFSEYPNVLCTTHVLAYKEDDGHFVLGNWLDYYSKDWKTVKRDNITFHYQVYKRDKSKIEKTIKFVEFLNKEYDVTLDHLDIYISKGWRETQKLKGFGYDFGETAISSTDDLGATTDIDNKIIYSNTYMGEFYPHEMMRFLRLRYKNVHPLITDGLSEYYSDTQVMRGKTFKELFQNLDMFLSAHPEIDLNQFDSFDSGNMTEKNYLIGMVIINLIESKCGHGGVIRALESIHTDEELIEFLDKNAGVKKEDINRVLRSKISQYANAGF